MTSMNLEPDELDARRGSTSPPPRPVRAAVSPRERRRSPMPQPPASEPTAVGAAERPPASETKSTNADPELPVPYSELGETVAQGVGQNLYKVGMIFASKRKREEAALDEQLALARVGRANILTVASPRGRCGKTTTALALGDILASTARLRCCVLDCDLEFGALRTAIEPRAISDHGLPATAEQWRAYQCETTGEMQRYVSLRRSGAHVLAPHGNLKRADDEVYELALEKLAGFYDVVICDLGQGVEIEHHVVATAVTNADQLIVVTTMDAQEAALTAHAAHYLRDAVDDDVRVLMLVTRAGSGKQRQAVDGTIADARLPVEHVPDDSHLGGLLSAQAWPLDRMAPATRIAYKRLAVRLHESFV